MILYLRDNFEEIDLPDKSFKFNENDWEEWGDSYCIIDQEEIQKKDHVIFKPTDLNGIVIRKDNNFPYIYNSNFDKQVSSLVLSR
ncbi:MAG: hypothetical protein KatS3mg068_1289 [Candidatus Sericytochromatia bacterium]|nr:MAG: hypothetical protein KatS3mg068_1289 [Candidatus Sericytochromatia bacterium]